MKLPSEEASSSPVSVEVLDGEEIGCFFNPSEHFGCVMHSDFEKTKKRGPKEERLKIDSLDIPRILQRAVK